MKATKRPGLVHRSNIVSILVGAAVIVLAGVLAYKGMGTPRAQVVPDNDAGQDSGALAVAAGADAGQSESGAEAQRDGGMFLSDLQLGVSGGALDTLGDGGAGFRMSDGTAVPPLPEKSPRAVRCGVVLIGYHGAQGASATARTKEAARELAEKLATDAKTDFHRAVQQGDTGSADDIGKVPRGILEPAPEYVLFTLAPGTVSDPVETPRGYWIVKRIE